MVYDRHALDGGPRAQSIRAVAPQLGVGEENLRIWCNRYTPAEGASRPQESLEEENRRLRRELARRAVLASGGLLAPAQPSNYRDDIPLRRVYVTETMRVAVWAARLALGDGEPYVYVEEPTEEIEDYPNVADKRLPCSHNRSYPILEPVCGAGAEGLAAARRGKRAHDEGGARAAAARWARRDHRVISYER